MDDHPVFRLGLRRLFERSSDLTVSWELDSTAELLRRLRLSPVEVLLMDLNLAPGDDSLAMTRAVVDSFPGTRVLVISALLDGDAATAARTAGASGYVSKDLSLGDMQAAIRQLAGNGIAPIVHGLFVTAGKVTVGSPWSARNGLTRREREVLVQLRRGRTNREIATQFGISVTTINKHVQQVLKKLQVRNRAQAVARLDAEVSGGSYQNLETGA